MIGDVTPNRVVQRSTGEYSVDELAKGIANSIVSQRDLSKGIGGALLGGLLASIPEVARAAPPPAKKPAVRPARVLIVMIDQMRPEYVDLFHMQNVKALMNDGV